MNLVQVCCPHCRTSNALPKASVGKVARCCRCKKQFPVKTERVSRLLVAQPTDISEPIMNTPSGVDDFIITQEAAAPPKPISSFDQLQDSSRRHARPESRKRNLARMRLVMRQRRRRRNIFLGVVLGIVILIAILVFNVFVIPSSSKSSGTTDTHSKRSTNR